jgi:hypothetical protein
MQYILTLLILFSPLSSISQTKCDEETSILKKSGFEQHYMNFVNFAYKFQGRCRGHSIVTQKSFYLMEFDRGENPHNCSKENFPFECQKFYFDKFARVFFHNEVVEIPGFQNFNEFSQMPYIEGLLRYHVSRTPTTFKTLTAHNRFLQNEENPSIAHFKEAVERVAENNKPYLAINSFWTGDHAVIAYKFKKDKDMFKLCVRDPNLIPDPTIDCENYFYLGVLRQTIPAATTDSEATIKESDEVFYHKRGEPEDRHLFTVRIYTEEDTRVKDYIQARYNYCLKLNALE